MSGCLKHDYNEGCIVCKPRMFLLIRGIGNRQMAVCHHTCPAGFYGVRSTHFNKCSSKKYRKHQTLAFKFNYLIKTLHFSVIQVILKYMFDYNDIFALINFTLSINFISRMQNQQLCELFHTRLLHQMSPRVLLTQGKVRD